MCREIFPVGTRFDMPTQCLFCFSNVSAILHNKSRVSRLRTKLKIEVSDDYKTHGKVKPFKDSHTFRHQTKTYTEISSDSVGAGSIKRVWIWIRSDSYIRRSPKMAFLQFLYRGPFFFWNNREILFKFSIISRISH